METPRSAVWSSTFTPIVVLAAGEWTDSHKQEVNYFSSTGTHESYVGANRACVKLPHIAEIFRVKHGGKKRLFFKNKSEQHRGNAF